MPAQPVDRRVRRSRTALEAALLELIAERELSQISVSDLTGRADVHRSTFYEHYTDVHDLAASACTQMFDQLITATAALPADDISSQEAAHHALTSVFGHVAEHRPLYRALLGADGSARVMNHLLEQMADGVRTGLGKRARRRTDLTPSAPAAAFIAGALLGTITDWLRRGCPETPEELSATVWPLLLATPTRPH
ncbi:TetR-like C-terminal domain-containing protein [Streptomyces iconiensis]|uniref:TetR-like C-terminal domain-containing protein n=1 Tax=Streptomyces iconiensis TaxID=1384038 RepID=A0ABT6ZNX7_9ACTN|nr:TetR-like C-terminal domain-containing protein [Streptomyces iconiensis]MDJ1130756.1 TetR-like C-terminal domain-containing protein [Streptomyces iconiensis]